MTGDRTSHTLDDFWTMDLSDLTLWLTRHGGSGPSESAKSRYARLVFQVRTQLAPAERLIEATEKAAKGAQTAAWLSAVAATLLTVLAGIELTILLRG